MVTGDPQFGLQWHRMFNYKSCDADAGNDADTFFHANTDNGMMMVLKWVQPDGDWCTDSGDPQFGLQWNRTYNYKMDKREKESP